MTKWTSRCVVLCGWLLATASLQAHHSLAGAYALKKEAKVTGSFKAFRLVNPHSSLNPHFACISATTARICWSTASIAASAALVFGRSPTLALLVMAYLFSFGAYMMNRSAEMDKDLASHPERTNYLAARRSILPGVVAASFLVGYVLVRRFAGPSADRGTGA